MSSFGTTLSRSRAAAPPYLFLQNVRVVTPREVLDHGGVLLCGDSIEAVDPAPADVPREAESVDGEGGLLIPGMIDLHSDALERFIEPRPGAVFPLPMAVTEFDRILVGSGITTMYHCVAFSFPDSRARHLRTNEEAMRIVEELHRLRPTLLGKTRVHARYDIVNREALPLIERLAREGRVDLVSFMDHTPGQGQFADLARYRERSARAFGRSLEEIDRHIERRREAQQSVDWSALEDLAAVCRRYGVATATHDDDSAERVRWAAGLGVGLSEFPVNEEALRAAREAGLPISLGAPNLVRGGSQSGNVSVREVLTAGFGHILCSDYAPMTMLQSIFVLEELGLRSLVDAVAMVTLEPARAAGISDTLGSVETGKKADLVLVDTRGEVPRVTRTFVDGREVFCAPIHIPAREE